MRSLVAAAALGAAASVVLVAKSAAAANRQVAQGYGRPSTTTRAKRVYWANYRSIDRDRDGTACER